MPSCVPLDFYVSALCLMLSLIGYLCALLLVCVRCLIVKLVRSVCVVFDFYVCMLSSVVFDFYVNARGVVLCSVLCCVDC